MLIWFKLCREKLHYYNVPCDTDPESPFNPLNIIKSIYKPGDFVVLKLDIDNEPIEQARAMPSEFLCETS